MAPKGFAAFAKAMPLWIHEKLQLPKQLSKGLRGEYNKRYVFTEHHESHAASAFYPSAFNESAILVMDGVGEWATATLGLGIGNKITLTDEMQFPHSLGLLYSAFTYFCGFKVNSGEYKLMGLAPYGEPKYVKLIYDNLIDLKDDGSFHMNLDYFDYCAGLKMTSKRFNTLFGGISRCPESPITQRELDIASSIQQVAEEVMLRMAKYLYKKTKCENLCMAGGVALNCVGNGRILKETPFRNVWIQPAAGDSGGALGAALFVWYQLLDNQRTVGNSDSQKGSLLGSSYSNEEVEDILKDLGACYKKVGDNESLTEQVAELLDQGFVVGWMQGRMEFGPRALGSRSILGDPRNPKMQSLMNLKIKFRESFRPFAPIVLKERVHEYFDLKPEQESPYMLLVAKVREDKRRESLFRLRNLDRVNEIRSVIPAVTHVDNSARIQTVDANRNQRLHNLLLAFEKRTGCPVLINTSFNIRSEPIVRSPSEAYRCFMATGMDVLVIENFILIKKDQPVGQKINPEAYCAVFKED